MKAGRIRIVQDYDYRWETDDYDEVKIAYLRSAREGYGTEGVTRDRMDEIRDGLENGSLVGLPVYVYSHSGATMRTTPFSCPRDSGQSGFVYMTKQTARGWGKSKTRLTKATKAKALEACRSLVKSYDQYLTGDVWGYVIDKAVEDPLRPGEQMLDENDDPVYDENDDPVYDEGEDSCWGFLGHDWKTNGMDLEYWLDKGYVIEED
jgi:hypothetical protein